MANYNVSGITPAQFGGKWDNGNSWFLIDEPGEFSVDRDITATIYLVGAGYNGGSATVMLGVDNKNLHFYYGGDGAYGGYVKTVTGVPIKSGEICSVNIGQNIPSSSSSFVPMNTTLNTSNGTYSSNGNGSVRKKGGQGFSGYSYIGSTRITVQQNATDGNNGVLTPYGYVGASGGGGSVYGSVANSPGGYGSGGHGSPIPVNPSVGTYSDYGQGANGCIIICVEGNELDFSVEKPIPNELTYNGQLQYPFNESILHNIAVSGDINGINAGKYTAILSLDEGMGWTDGTSDPITIDWEIKKASVPKPTIDLTEYEYDGNGNYDSTCYKLPVISGFDEYIMSKSGNGLVKQYRAGTYGIIFTLNDPDSCTWDDGSIEDYVVSWTIKPKVAKIPVVADGNFTYNGTAQSAVVDNVDDKIMSASGDTGALVNAGNYYITYTLRDTDSCSWEDDTITPKTVYWNIDKQIVLVEKPYLVDDQKKFDYDGNTHTPVISGSNNSLINFSGTFSSVAAGNWEIVAELKTNANIVYQWADGSTGNISLPWVICVSIFGVPTLEFIETDYNGLTQTNTVTGYNPVVMTQAGTLLAKGSGEYTVTYSLKDKSSAVWDDGTTEDKPLTWKINSIVVAIPTAPEPIMEIVTSYSNGTTKVLSQTLLLYGYDRNIMTLSGSTQSYAGEYTAVVGFKDKRFCIWEDGTTEDKPIKWEIARKIVELEKPCLSTTALEYNGLTQSVTINGLIEKYNGIICMKSTGETSAVSVKKYNVTIELQTQNIYEYHWSDGSTDPVALEWEIKPIKVDIPSLSPLAFKYDGTVKAPVESGYNANIMTRSADSVSSAVAADKYSVKYSLKDSEHNSWSDGSSEDKVINWVITEGDLVEIPTVSPIEFEYDGLEKEPKISEYNTAVISQKGVTSAVNAGDYSITFSLKSPESCCWTDGTVEDKVFKWKITKKAVLCEKPSLAKDAFDYNGKNIAPNFVGFDSRTMLANNPYRVTAGEYTTTVSLKTDTNYLYKWVDGTTADVKLEWEINKITVKFPVLSETMCYYGGSHYNEFTGKWTYGYRHPSIAGYNPDIMLATGVSEGYRKSDGEFVDTENKWYCTSQWRLGKYYVKFSFRHPGSCVWEDGTNGLVVCEWTIQRKVILLEKPYLVGDVFVYDGTVKKPDVVNGNVAGVLLGSTLSETAAGVYTITVALNRFKSDEDVYDYRWKDNTVGGFSLNWLIEKQYIPVPTIVKSSFVYDGTPHLPEFSGFDENTMNILGNSSKTAAGEYEIIISLKDPESAVWVDGSVEDKTFKWSIEKAAVQKPSIVPTYMEYDGENHTVEFIDNQNDHSFVVSGFKDVVMTRSGDLSAVDVGNYKTVIALKDPESCAWNDGSIGNIELPWEIRKKTVLLDKPYLESDNFLYDGTTHTPVIKRFKTPGMSVKDGSVKSAIAAGEYIITLVLQEDKNITYLWGDAENNTYDGELELAWSILGAVGENAVETAVVSPLKFVYDGSRKEPKISGCDTNVIDVSGDTSAVNAGEYVIIFSLKDKNSSEWADGGTADKTKKWVITKAFLDGELYLEPLSYTFDGNRHTPAVKGVDTSCVVISGDTAATKAGDYEIRVSPNKNYQWADGTFDVRKLPWMITVLTVEKPFVFPLKFQWDNTQKTPTLTYNKIFSTVSGNITATAAGEYPVTFALRDKASCVWTDGSVADVTFKWNIRKAVVEKPVASPLEFVYDGDVHAPDISEYDINVILQTGTESAVNAGGYTITFALRDSKSATWSDGSTADVVFDWRIKKAVVKKPRVENTEFNYNSGTHAPTIRDMNDTLAAFRSDSVNNAVDAGIHHIYVTLKDKQNYEWSCSSSDDLDFEWIVHGRPVDKPRLEKSAFEYDGDTHTPNILGFKPVSMDKSGQLSSIGIGDYEIIISLKKNYEWRDGGFDDFALPWSITQIIVSAPVVSDLEFLYDGAVHSPKISDFNADVISQNGTASAVNAGNYKIVFSLKDKESCAWDTGGRKDIVVDWVISKVVLEKPVGVDLDFVYNGGYHFPVIEGFNGEYMTAYGDTRQVNADTYTYTIKLKDKVNYIWSDSTTSDVVFKWVIARKVVDMPYLDPDLFYYDRQTKTTVIHGFNREIMEYVYNNSSPQSTQFNAVDVGTYRVTVRLGVPYYDKDGFKQYLRNYQWVDGSMNDIVLYWQIVRGKIKYPVMIDGSLVYNTFSQSPVLDGYLADVMDVIGNASGTHAGNYEIGFKLKDNAGFEWEHPADEERMLPWEIQRKPLSKTLDVPYAARDVIYNTYEQSPVWVNYNNFILKIGGVYSAIHVGEYTAEFTPTKNYVWDDGTTDPVGVVWRIVKRPLKIPVQEHPLYYNGQEQSPTFKTEFRGIVDFRGEMSGITVGAYDVHCVCNDDCYFEATGTNECDTEWSIQKKKLYVPIGNNYPYTGETIIPKFERYYPELMTMSGDTSSVDVGDYTAIFELKDKDNYEWADYSYINGNGKAAVGWKIISTQKRINIPYQSNYLIYNGEKQSPIFANYNEKFMILIGGIPSRIYAGVNYVTFRLEENVIWADGTTEDKEVPWTIYKKKIPCPDIRMSIADGGMYYYTIEGRRYPVWNNYDPEIMRIEGDTYDEDDSWHTTYFTLKDPANYEWKCGDYDKYSVNWKLSEAYDPDRVPAEGNMRVHIPRQVSPPYENGKVQYPKWDMFNSVAIMKIGGDWDGISAGTYYVMLELVDGYVWEDETTEIKLVPWVIFPIGSTETDSSLLIKIHIPEQINIPSFDGLVKEPEWDIWDKFGIDIVEGDLYGVLAGLYYVILRPQTGYIWEDGTLEEKIVVWMINIRETVEIPDDEIPKAPEPERDGEENGGNSNGGYCCCTPCCDTGLFEILKNSCVDDGNDGCDCS